jgi:Zn-dependent protease with chaperone function
MFELYYNELVEELEQSASENQRAYRVRVASLAALGYAYVVGVVVLLLWAAWLVFGMIHGGRSVVLLKLAVPLALLSLAGMRALWVRIEPPEGTVLTAEDAPQLFALLEKIRKKLDGPRIHRVVMDDEFNAAIMQVPRFGILGGTRNYLIIGLPLMQSLSVEQFAAVLAHEYGHLSGAHGKFSAWIYRVRMTWIRLFEALVERRMWGSTVFLAFFRWYVPYFQAYSFVLARANEYEADQAAADVAGARNAAEALVTVEVVARFLTERFWNTYMSGADKSPAPATLPYAQLPMSLNVGMDETDADLWLKAALLEQTGVDDTHPCLKDRLAALGETPAMPAKPATTAAKVLLGARHDAIVKGFDKAWAKRALREWTERHEESRKLRDEAAKISRKAKSGGALTAGEWTVFGQACQRFSDAGKAEGYFRKAIELAPDYPEAHMALALRLLERRDAAAVGHLDKVIAAGGNEAMHASTMAARFLRESGRPRDAERYDIKVMAQASRAQEKEAHEVYLLPNDNFASNTLTAKELGLCRALFRRMQRIASVHAVCKVMPGAGELHTVFLVHAKLSALDMALTTAMSFLNISPKEDGLAQRVVDALRMERPFTVFQDLYVEDEIGEKIRAVEGALVYEA